MLAVHEVLGRQLEDHARGSRPRTAAGHCEVDHQVGGMGMPTAVIIPAGALSGLSRQLSAASLAELVVAGIRLEQEEFARAPSSTSLCSSSKAGSQRRSWPTPRTLPAARRPRRRGARLAGHASGFSQSRFLPAAVTFSDCSSWSACGVASTTPSTASSASTSSRLVADQAPRFPECLDVGGHPGRRRTAPRSGTLCRGTR